MKWEFEDITWEELLEELNKLPIQDYSSISKIEIVSTMLEGIRVVFVRT